MRDYYMPETPITDAMAVTNADRIREMSDEELADFLADKYVTESCLRLNDKGYEATEIQKRAIKHTLYYTWMKWLQQPI